MYWMWSFAWVMQVFPFQSSIMSRWCGSLAVCLLFGYATFNWLLLSAAKLHQPPVQPDKRKTTGTAGSPNTTHVLCLTPQSQMLSIRVTLMDSLRYRSRFIIIDMFLLHMTDSVLKNPITSTKQNLQTFFWHFIQLLVNVLDFGIDFGGNSTEWINTFMINKR